jgi:hypothetical protein
MQDTSQIELSGIAVFEAGAAAGSTAQSDDVGGSELDTRQDEILRLLDELNAQIEAVIREFAPAVTSEDRRAAA